VAHHRAAILRTQDEKGDDVAFPLLALDDEVAPSVPTVGRRYGVVVDLLFAADQDIGEKPVGLSPQAARISSVAAPPRISLMAPSSDSATAG
jgi:hypothetical protein